MKTHINSEFSFEVWINDQSDSFADETDSFDDNWLVSGGDLFNGIDLPTDEPLNYYDEAA